MVSYSKTSGSDLALLEVPEIKKGDFSEITHFIEACEPIIAKFASQFSTLNSSDFEDLMQEGRLAALRAVKCFPRGKNNFEYYVRKSIKNAILLEGRIAKRKSKNNKLYYSSDACRNLFDASVNSTYDGFEQIESDDVLPVIKSKINKWRKSLSPQKQKIIDLVFYKRMKQSQAASKMGLTRSRVGQIMHEILGSGKIHLADIAELN
ncbi:MAG: sigma-70 family RNA polymerase sigma factor [Planctomycetota bacterium]|jgi:RNA polymerase sigma factor (sigma-70 family)